MKRLALFDLDNTLLNGDSDYEWGQFMCDRGVVDRASYEAENRAVAPRSRDLNKDLGSMPLTDFVGRLVEESKAPRLRSR